MMLDNVRRPELYNGSSDANYLWNVTIPVVTRFFIQVSVGLSSPETLWYLINHHDADVKDNRTRASTDESSSDTFDEMNVEVLKKYRKLAESSGTEEEEQDNEEKSKYMNNYIDNK